MTYTKPEMYAKIILDIAKGFESDMDIFYRQHFIHITEKRNLDTFRKRMKVLRDKQFIFSNSPYKHKGFTYYKHNRLNYIQFVLHSFDMILNNFSDKTDSFHKELFSTLISWFDEEPFDNKHVYTTKSFAKFIIKYKNKSFCSIDDICHKFILYSAPLSEYYKGRETLIQQEELRNKLFDFLLDRESFKNHKKVHELMNMLKPYIPKGVKRTRNYQALGSFVLTIMIYFLYQFYLNKLLDNIELFIPNI